MKKTLAIVIVISAFTSCTNSNVNKVDTSKPTELATELDSVSYILGENYAKGLTENTGLKALDNKSFLTGMQRAFEEQESEISEEDASTLMRAFFTKQKEAKSLEIDELEKVVLDSTRAMDGVVVTESGLQYKIIAKGDGPVPTREDKVKVHYTGTLLDGTVFDSSVKRGEPLEIGVGQVIPGWTEALTMMPVGSKWELIIPSKIGYGARASGPIPANSILKFEVELLDIIK